MADVITRFKLETTQYDSKLRDASQALSQYARHASFAGKEFDKFTKNNADAARALGSISTSANNAKDKVKELVAAYNQAANAYNALTKEQQQSDWGQALAESIQKLKGRITEAKQELYSMGDSAENSGGIMDQLASKFTVNIDALKLFNAGVTAAKAALDVAKDAFFASEAAVDEWGRTVLSVESLYQGFLTSINNGDISGYLDRMDEIVRAARAAYDEMDKLNTMKTIQSPQFSKQEAENTRMRLMLMTGRYIAPAAGSGQTAANGLKTGDILTKEQLRAIEEHLKNGMKTIVDLTGREIKQTGRAINEYYNSLAKQNGISLQEFKKGTSSWAEFTKRLQMADKYNEFERQHTITVSTTGSNGLPIYSSHRDNAVNPYEQYRGWDVFRVDKMGRNSYNELVGLIRQQQQQQSQMYSTIGQAYRTINRAEGITTRQIIGGASGGGGGTTEIFSPDSITAQKKLVAELTKQWENAGAAVKDKYKVALEEAQAELDRMTGKDTFDPSRMQQITDLSGRTPWATPEILTHGTELTLPVKLDIESPAQKLTAEIQRLKDLMNSDIWDTESVAAYQQRIQELEAELAKFRGTSVSGAKDSSKAWSNAATVISSVGSALNNIQDPSAKIVAIVAQGIASLVAAYGDAFMKDESSKKNIYQFLATTISGTAQMIAQISQIHSATGYAQGGIVDGRGGGFVSGTAYSGDNVGNVRLDSGELVLNRAQQGVIAGALEGNAGRSVNVTGYLRGEDIVLVADRWGRRTGKGELAFWK